MESKKGLFVILVVVLLFGCKKDWEQHYSTFPATSKTNVWAAIQADKDLTQFVKFVKDYHYDTLFTFHNTYTLFVPTDVAFTQFLATDTFGRTVLNYLICNTFIQSSNIQGTRKVQTMSKKFALLVNQGNGLFLDDIPVSYESPLYLNGKYFKMGKVDLPKPNLYQYIAATNPILKAYIDSKDSVVLNLQLSKPIGFDSHGNTIYDSVTYVDNSFEDKFFPVKDEYRNTTATLVFPKSDDYNAALTLVAQSLNFPAYHDYHDIPLSWQNKILIPYLLEHGIFPNLVELSEFLTPTSGDTIKMKNILGDSIIINYVPTQKTICSNGYAYNYSNFKVPDTLFAASSRMEGEYLLYNLGINRYAYKSNVQVTSSQTFNPQKLHIAGASNDTILAVNFPLGYSGTYKLTFNVDNLFPRKYLMTVKTNINLGGIYNLYVNGVLVKTFDYYSYTLNSGVYVSVTGKKFKTVNGFNIFDCWVTNLTDYGKAQITFEYAGPSIVRANGLSIDYIGFTPY